MEQLEFNLDFVKRLSDKALGVYNNVQNKDASNTLFLSTRYTEKEELLGIQRLFADFVETMVACGEMIGVLTPFGIKEIPKLSPSPEYIAFLFVKLKDRTALDFYNKQYAPWAQPEGAIGPWFKDHDR